MDYGYLLLGNAYTPQRLSSYLDAFVQNTQPIYNASTCISTLNSLQNQKGYLEALLSKTATTLNALRDRQTRNERALSKNPGPRSKRKKIQQNKWRTNKTIQTCENEERAILGCLQVCRNNINTLEAIIGSTCQSSTAIEHTLANSYAYSDTINLDWTGWADDAALSPFQKDRERSLHMDEIPPEAPLKAIASKTGTMLAIRPEPLLSNSDTSLTEVPPPAPPNTALVPLSHSTLSPIAAVFEPSVMDMEHKGNDVPMQLDKLSISGLLASKRMLLIQKRRFSDAALGYISCRLSSNARPGMTAARLHHSWAAPTPQRQKQERGAAIGSARKRNNSV